MTEPRRALVTGGGSGVGAVIAATFAGAGIETVICGRRAEALERVASGHALIQSRRCDITDETQIAELFALAGPFDIVIANAGASESAPFAKTTLDSFRHMVDVNLTGTFLTLREGARTMTAGGRLIAIASTAGLKGYSYVAPYAAAKHGVIGLIRSIAQEYARKGITANAVCPGFLDTEMTERSIAHIMAKTGRSEQDARAQLAATNPMHRLVPPQDVADAVMWLCGAGSAMVTGQAISVSGGEI